jgi:hypothetical protein
VEIHPFGRQIPDGGYPKTFIPAFSSTVVISGTSLQTGTFTNANSLYAHCQVQATSVQADGLWTQHFASTSPSSEVGTFSLSISSVGSITATDAARNGEARTGSSQQPSLRPRIRPMPGL